MRELRTCPVSGRTVLLNDDWLDRPAAPIPPEEPCRLCAEEAPTIARLGEARARPSLPYALGVEGDPQPVVLAGAVRRQAVGAHELILAGHDATDAALLPLVAARWHDLRRDTRLRGFSAIRRHVPGAHVAWQVFATPHELPGSIPAGWRESERAHGRRVLRDAAAFTLLAWAPRVPFETWVMPAMGIDGLERSAPEVVRAVGVAIAEALETLRGALRDPPIDLVLVDGEPFRVELLPRLAPPSPVEVATGMPLHGVFPEAAVEYLRDAERSAS